MDSEHVLEDYTVVVHDDRMVAGRWLLESKLDSRLEEIAGSYRE